MVVTTELTAYTVSSFCRLVKCTRLLDQTLYVRSVI